MNGVLLIDKPVGMTSRAVVDSVIRSTGFRTAGHAGTLDPFASGLLPVCVGRATKLVPYIHMGIKTYRATLLLGSCTDTDDVTGKVEWCTTIESPFSDSVLKTTLQQFVGVSKQRTPRYSARKIAGVRMYQLARRSIPVKPPIHEIQIYRIEVLSYRHPEVEFEVDCTTGTYIRSLGYDIGCALGCGAVLKELRRLRVAAYRIDQAVSLDAIEVAAKEATLERHVHAPKTAVSTIPSLQLKASSLQRAKNGCQLEASDFIGTKLSDELLGKEISVFDENCTLISIGVVTAGIDIENHHNIFLKTVRVIDISK